jgi:hypothetical protein
MFCRSCGTQLRDDAAFCRSCGTPVRAAGAAEALPETPDETTTVPFAPQTAVPAPPAPGAYPVPPAPTASKAGPIAVAIAAVVVLVVAGLLLWQSGIIGKMLPSSKTASASGQSSEEASSTAATSTAGGGSAPTTDGAGASGSNLTDSESYKAIVDEWESLKTMRADYGEPYDRAKPGDGTGWLFAMWAKNIGNKNVSASTRAALATDAKQRLDAFTTARDRFAALAIASAYATSRAQVLDVYDKAIARADIYYRTAEYAVDHPTISKGNEPWRAIQKGSSGKASTEALFALLDAVDAYTAPTAP